MVKRFTEKIKIKEIMKSVFFDISRFLIKPIPPKIKIRGKKAATYLPRTLPPNQGKVKLCGYIPWLIATKRENNIVMEDKITKTNKL